MLHLAVGGSLAASSPLVLVDKNTLNLALGAFAGMVATAAVFPIDTAKTKIQSQSGQDGEAALNTLETICALCSLWTNYLSYVFPAYAVIYPKIQCCTVNYTVACHSAREGCV